MLPEGSLQRPATGVDAALLMKRAVNLVEPALPALSYGTEAPLPPDDPNYDVVSYLSHRQLLPETWEAGELAAEAWSSMLSTFLGWYQLRAVSPPLPATVEDLIEDLSAVLGDVSEAVRPAAVLATDASAGRHFSFVGVIWNWSVYPRLLVLRPLDDAPDRPRDVLPLLGNCAVQVRSYISAPRDLAQRLFLTHNSSRMYVVGSEPDHEFWWPYEVPAGQELEAFVYHLPELDGVNVYGAVFAGPSIGMGALVTMLPRFRTNISPLNLARYFQTPE